MKQHRVDEQLLKIRLKLSEPSIEKVWLFSLLFVILSIVVSMGGLIVLPFVKKTTRRRILTLFEGLAVGGLTGSATLHMFPQAFGLVGESYHRYFWRIVVVFLGIYLCYLCERAIKILRVVRAKCRRRSRASLIDMDFRYGFSSINRQLSGNGEGDHHSQGSDHFVATSQPEASHTHKVSRPSEEVKSEKKKGRESGRHRVVEEDTVRGDERASEGLRKSFKKKKKKEDSRSATRKNSSSKKYHKRAKGDNLHENTTSDAEESPSPPIELDQSMEPARQRLIRCLKSVRSQFTPVYAVFSQPTAPSEDHRYPGQASKRIGSAGHRAVQAVGPSSWSLGARGGAHHNPRRDRLLEMDRQARQLIERQQDGSKSAAINKRQARHKEIETMLYHRNLIEQQQKGGGANQGSYQQRQQHQTAHRFSDVNDLVSERQDRDNPARMSVDTVPWMILFGDGLLNVIDGLSIGAAFERNILAGISISVAVMLEEVTHRLGTTAILIRTGMSIKQSFLCTFLSACALFPGMIVGIMLSDATDEATPYIFCAAGGIFLYTGLVDVMKEMNRSIENAMRKDIKTTLKIFALQNVGIILAVVFLSFLALYEPDFEEYQKILNNN